MSEIHLTKLDNGAYTGLVIREITSIPLARRLGNSVDAASIRNTRTFIDLLNAVHHFTGIQDTAVELLLLTAPAIGQVYQAQIRMFLVLRRFGTDHADIARQMTGMVQSCEAALKAGQYTMVPVQFDAPDFLELLSKIRKPSAFALVKAEKSRQGITQFGGNYPFADLFVQDTSNNYISLIDALSRHVNMAVSFSLIPTSFEEEEAGFILEMERTLTLLGQGYNDGQQYLPPDMPAKEASSFYSHFSANSAQPLFLYGLYVLGTETDCADVVSRLQAALQYGKEGTQTEIRILKMTSTMGEYSNEFPAFPWNAITANISVAMKNSPAVALSPAFARLTHIITLTEACAFFRLPVDDGNLIGLSSNSTIAVREKLKGKLFTPVGILLGRMSGIGAENQTIGVPLKSFTRHALIVGMPGTGKTTFAINLLLQFHQHKVPFLAIEPTKTEYRAMMDAVEGLQVFTPGKNNVVPFIMNPFLPPEGISLESFMPSLVSAFKAAFSMPPPLDILFLKSVNACYTKHGWRSYSKQGDIGLTVFSLHEFVMVFKELIQHSAYSQEIKGNLESAGVFRLMNLIEQSGNIYDTIHSMPLEDLLCKPTVLELNAIDNQEQKSLLMALLLINIVLYTKHFQINDGTLKNILLIDEAHVLLAPGGIVVGENVADATNMAVKALQNMVAEIRSYGTGILIADQSPGKVTKEIVGNTDIKVMFRLVQREDKQLIADSTNMSEQDMDQLSKLGVGEAYTYFEGLPEPQMIMTDDIRNVKSIRLHVPDEEIKARMTYWDDNSALLKPYALCENLAPCEEGCDFDTRSDAKYCAERLFELFAPHIKEKKNLIGAMMSLTKHVGRFLPPVADTEKRARLYGCIGLHFLRQAEMNLPFRLSTSEAGAIIGNIVRDSGSSS